MPGIVPMERIANRIYLIRKIKVLIDRDLAEPHVGEGSSIRVI